MSIDAIISQIVTWLPYVAAAWAVLVTMILVRFYRAVPATKKVPPVEVHPLLMLSATAIGAKLRAGEVTSTQLVELSIKQIEAVNPYVNAMVFTRFEEARKEAQAADALLEAYRRRANPHPNDIGWLVGIPGTIKECIAVEGCPQTAGLPSRKDYRCPQDAPQVQRLKAAGAIVLGVTNTSELCMWMESSNYVYGVTNNAYDTRRIVGGSSGGEGCAQCAYFGYFGLGSDIGGSIRMPAYFNGVFGHKPSTRLVPNLGQHPGAKDKAHFLLCTGPITRFAEDLYPLLRTLSDEGFDEELPRKHYPRCLTFGDRPPSKVNLKRVKVYCLPDLNLRAVKASSSQRKATMKACEVLEKEFGCTVIRVDWRRKETVPKGWEMIRYAFDIWSALASEDSNSFQEMMSEGYDIQGKPFAAGKELLKTIVGWNPQHTIPASALCLIEHIQKKFVPAARSEAWIAKGRQLQKDIEQELGSNGVIITPTYPATVPKHHRPLMFPFQWVYTALFNAMQTPTTAVPIWLDEHQRLPLGVQCVASWGHDDVSLAIAEALSKTSIAGHRPPKWVRIGTWDQSQGGVLKATPSKSASQKRTPSRTPRAKSAR